MIALTAHPQGTVLLVRAQPGARKNAVLGERAGALRVAVTAAPERGKANEAIRKVLAEVLGCKASQITLLAGEAARDKKFLVSEMTSEDVQQRIGTLLIGDLTAESAERKTEKGREVEN